LHHDTDPTPATPSFRQRGVEVRITPQNPDTLDRRPQLLDQSDAADPVLDIGRHDQQGPQQTQRVHGHKPLTPVDFFFPRPPLADRPSPSSSPTGCREWLRWAWAF